MGEAPNVLDYTDYRDFLGDYAQHKQNQTDHWSLGSWARCLKLSGAPALSMVIKRRRHIGKKLEQQLVDYFDFNEKERQYFSELVRIQKKVGNPTLGVFLLKDLKRRISTQPNTKTSLMFSWLTYVLREVFSWKTRLTSLEKLAQKLPRSLSEADLLKQIDQMKEHGLLVEDEESRLRPAPGAYSVDEAPSTELVSCFNNEILQNSEAAFEQSTLDERSCHFSMLKLKKDRLPEAKAKLREFQRQFTDEFESQEDGDIMQMTIQLVPILKEHELQE